MSGAATRRASPTPEQAAAIEVRGRDVLLEAGAGTGKTGVMVDRYCRLVCDEGVSPDAILAFTFTDKAAAELRAADPRRAGAARRARATSGPASCWPGIGGAWVTTIHGFCNRAARRPPGRRRDRPPLPRARRAGGRAGGARGLRRGAGGVPRRRASRAREETVAAFDIDGLRAMVVGAHAELRSRGDRRAARCPSRRAPDLGGGAATRGRGGRGGAGGAEAGQRQPRAAASGRWRSSRARPAARPRRAGRAARPSSKAKAAGRLPGGDRGGGRPRRRGGRGRRRLPPPRRAAASSSPPASRRPRSGARGSTSRTCRSSPRGLLERAEIGERLPRPLQPPAGRRVPGHQPPAAAADRGAARAAARELMVVGDELQSIYGFRHADLDVFREQRERDRARAPTPS